MSRIIAAMLAPETINNVHESCYKAHHTLLIVQEMLGRKDSHQTIQELIDSIYDKEIPNTPIKL